MEEIFFFFLHVQVFIVYNHQNSYDFYLNNNLMTVNSYMQLMTVSDLQLGQKPR